MLKNNNSKKNKLLIDDNLDENEVVNWYDETINTVIFNCGCCDNCSCIEQPCDDCQCDCNSNDTTEKIDNLSDFNITIIKNKKLGNKVRITLKINVILNNKENENMSIDCDINKSTYLKITNELYM